MKSGGIFAANYLLYKIKTEAGALDWTIMRKDADFYFLRKILVKRYPYLIVPPLPTKKKKESEKSIKRREKYLTRFLQGVVRCEQFKSNLFLQEWLHNDDIKAFAKIMKDEDKFKFKKGMANVISKDGKVPAQMI
jgi:hypothetical protein